MIPTGVIAASLGRTLRSTITWPQPAAHRLGQWRDGEETLAAADISIAEGVQVLECDFWPSSDSVDYLMHDESVTRTTTSTGNITGMTAATVDGLVVDPNTFMQATGYDDTFVPSLARLFGRYKRRAVMLIQQKSTSTGGVAALAADMRAAGLRDCVIVASTSDTVCEAWIAQGFSVQRISDTSLTAADYAAAGYEWLCYAFTDTGTSGEKTRIAAAVSAGLKVATYTHSYRGDALAAIAEGSSMPISAHATQVTRTAPTASSVDFSDGRYPQDCISLYTPTIASGRLYNTTTSTEPNITYGSLGPTGQYPTMSMTFRFTATPGAGWGGVCLQDVAHDRYKKAAGYIALLRGSGVYDLYRYTSSGTATKIGTTTTAAPAANTDYELTLQVTATHVVATRVDTADTISVADTTYRTDQWWPIAVRVGATANVAWVAAGIS